MSRFIDRKQKYLKNYQNLNLPKASLKYELGIKPKLKLSPIRLR